jgi:hypothetical protein
MNFKSAIRERRWNENLEKLKCFLKRYGHCCVPVPWSEDVVLGNWVHSQRERRRLGQLSEERIRHLDELGFAWYGQTHSIAWAKKLKELKKYKSRHGHCNVFAAENVSVKLLTWARYQYQQKRLGRLSPVRVRQLDELGFIWDIRLSVWERHLNELQEFKRRHRHCNVSMLSKADGKLGNWVRFQRRARKLGKLSATRIQQLDSLGFTWGSIEDKWKVMFAALAAFQRLWHHCRIPVRSTRLGRWVATQRASYRKGRLSNERVRQLESLEFQWKAR